MGLMVEFEDVVDDTLDGGEIRTGIIVSIPARKRSVYRSAFRPIHAQLPHLYATQLQALLLYGCAV